MNERDTTSDDYRAGYLAGYTDRQTEVDRLENEADRFYRAAYGEERRIPGQYVTRAELEQRRTLSEPPAEITRRDALASWGFDVPPTDTLTDFTTASSPAPPSRTNRTSRRRQMSTRTITGNLAADPEAVQAGRVQIVKLRVIENTGEYRGGEWTPHEAPTTHFVEAKFELGEHVLASLHKGVANRDTWTVDRVHRDGSVSVSEGAKTARLPREYVEQNTHLAYASTEYGVQGATVDHGHGVITDASSAQAVYVAATRGREHNVLHVVAGSDAEARDVFASAMGREAGDRGTDAARDAAQRDVEGIVLPDHDHDPQMRSARMAAEERVYQSEMRAWESATKRWQERNPDLLAGEYPAALAAAESAAAAATAAREALEETIAAEAVATGQQQWASDYTAVTQADAAAESASVFRRSAVQRDAEAARAQFQVRHRATPAPSPTAAHKAAWARAATSAGAHASLDAARAKEQAAIARHARLAASPAPGGKPAAPRPGTAEEEARKDAAFAARRAPRTQRQEAAAERAKQPQKSPEQSPSLER